MTEEEFKDGFRKLVKAFTVAKPDDKSVIYFEKLEKLSAETFFKTVDHCLSNTDKFPSIMKIIEISRLFPTRGNDPTKCDVCHGSGMVSRWKHGFRCRCLNGERISKHMALLPVGYEESKAMYERLDREWFALYGEHLQKEGIINKAPLPLTDEPVVNKAIELFGATIIKPR